MTSEQRRALKRLAKLKQQQRTRTNLAQQQQQLLQRMTAGSKIVRNINTVLTPKDDGSIF